MFHIVVIILLASGGPQIAVSKQSFDTLEACEQVRPDAIATIVAAGADVKRSRCLADADIRQILED